MILPLNSARRVVLKIGSVLVADEYTGIPRREWLDSLAADVDMLRRRDIQCVIVTSGAVAMGRRNLGISGDVRTSALPLEYKQAAAAMGQITLFQAYRDAFADHNLPIAQILLTPADTEKRRTHLNARATVAALLENEAVPIINENDTITTADLRFGDNDRLAARVAQMIEADTLMILSTIDGMYTANPELDPNAEFVPEIPQLEPRHFEMAGPPTGAVTTGGMSSKIEAARLATEAGVQVIISRGTGLRPLRALEEDGARFTLIRAREKPGRARKRWIAAHVDCPGRLCVDSGAAKALRAGKSLLPAGILSLEGSFERGDPLHIVEESGRIIATGLSAYSAKELVKIIGRNSREIQGILGYRGREEAIHRDDLALREMPQE